MKPDETLAFRRLFDEIYQTYRHSSEVRTNSRLTSLSVALALRSGLLHTIAFEGRRPTRIGSDKKRVRETQDPRELVGPIQNDRYACLKAMRTCSLGRYQSAPSDSHPQEWLASRVPLLDMLPDFLVLSARTALLLGQTVSRQWMDLAASFMFQAALEHYTTNAPSGLNELDIAFAWGWVKGGSSLQERYDDEVSSDDAIAASDIIEINDAFCSPDGDAQIDGWQATRLEYKARFLAIGQKPWDEHVDDLARRFTPHHFEQRLLDYLDSLFIQIQTRPILVQMEEGQVEGLSRSETNDLRRRAFTNR